MKYAIGHVGNRVRAPRMVVLVALVVVALLAVALPVSAHGRSRLTVSGNAVGSDCNAGEGIAGLELTGDIEGCLTLVDYQFECVELNGFARYRERGTEKVVGTLNGEPGSFDTRYTLEGTYTSGSCAEFDAGGFPAQNQLTGGCDHRIVNPTGAFENVRGTITFFDVIPDPGESGASNFLYAADLRVRK